MTGLVNRVDGAIQSRTDTTELARLRAALCDFERRVTDTDELGSVGWALVEMDAARIAKLSHWRGEIKDRLRRLVIAAETRDPGEVRQALGRVHTLVGELMGDEA